MILKYWSLVYCYHARNELRSLLGIKDLAEYGPRRRLWNKAFSSASLKVFENNIIKRANELVDALESVNSTVVDIGRWMEYLA
jgi:cytochrome P450